MAAPATTLDLRWRVDGQEDRPASPAELFDVDLPAALAAWSDEFGVPEWVHLVPLTIEVGDEGWLLSTDEAGRPHLTRGRGDEGATVRLTPAQVADLACDQATFMGFFTQGTLDQPRGRLEHLLDWWLVLRGAIDGRGVHEPGSIGFHDAYGRPLDLQRSFRLDDDRAEMTAFLTEAGFLHLEGVFTDAEMAAIGDDMDRAASSYAPDDGRSWWATTHDGTERLVRLQGFEQHSPASQALFADERFQRVGALSGAGHQWAGVCQALEKPVGVVAGISDVPWHKDCSLGRHSYDCCSMTVGLSVTGAGADTGQLRVVAGSHRTLVWPAFLRKGTALPEVDLPTATGDVTIHLSCTLHMSQPPVAAERRVVYTGFRLPPADPDAVGRARKQLYRIMEEIPPGVSQKPGFIPEASARP
jgi:Phytanoyl-CoA dioxygenase (PhyH)